MSNNQMGTPPGSPGPAKHVVIVVPEPSTNTASPEPPQAGLSKGSKTESVLSAATGQSVREQPRKKKVELDMRKKKTPQEAALIETEDLRARLAESLKRWNLEKTQREKAEALLKKKEEDLQIMTDAVLKLSKRVEKEEDTKEKALEIARTLERKLHTMREKKKELIDAASQQMLQQSQLDGHIKSLEQKITDEDLRSAKLRNKIMVGESRIKTLQTKMESLHAELKTSQSQTAEEKEHKLKVMKLLQEVAEGNGAIQSINLRHAGLTDSAGNVLLKIIQKLHGVNTVDLSYNELTDGFATCLAEMVSEIGDVVSISLEGNSITAQGVFAIAQKLNGNKVLKQLNVQKNKISSVEDVLTLLQTPPNYEPEDLEVLKRFVFETDTKGIIRKFALQAEKNQQLPALPALASSNSEPVIPMNTIEEGAEVIVTTEPALQATQPAAKLERSPSSPKRKRAPSPAFPYIHTNYATLGRHKRGDSPTRPVWKHPHEDPDFKIKKFADMPNLITALDKDLALGLSINAYDSEADETLLLFAARTGNVQLAKFCLRKGADPYLENRKGQNAFTVAVRAKRHSLMEYMMNMGHKISLPDGTGQSALHIATINKDEDTICRLVEAGADINVQDLHDGRSPLHYAAMSGSAHLCMLLLGLGADLQQRDNKEFTAVAYAEANDHFHLMDTLSAIDGDETQTTAIKMQGQKPTRRMARSRTATNALTDSINFLRSRKEGIITSMPAIGVGNGTKGAAQRSMTKSVSAAYI